MYILFFSPLLPLQRLWTLMALTFVFWLDMYFLEDLWTLCVHTVFDWTRTLVV